MQISDSKDLDELLYVGQFNGGAKTGEVKT